MKHIVEKDYKDYLAFISYNHDDEDMAAWLQDAIESFKLPTDLITDHPELVGYKSRHLFRDKTDMAGGVLPDIIKEALESSQYLIVICSPNVLKSTWVDKEIDYFLSLNDDNYKKIIPFVIDGEPYSKNNECLPKAIQSIPKSKELLAINLNDFHGEDYKQIAVVKVLSSLLKLKFDTLWNRHSRREAEQKAIQIAEKKKYQILESQFLCKSAEDYLERGNVYDAFITILQSLPIDLSDERDRPYVAECERVFRKIMLSNFRYPEDYGKDEPSYQWAISHDGYILATKDGNDSAICIWDARNKVLINELPGFLGKFCAFEFSSDDTKLLIASQEECTIRLFCINTGTIIKEIKIPPYIEYVVVSNNEKQLLTVSWNGNLVLIWDLLSGECLDTITIDTPQHFKEISPIPELSRDNRFVIICYRNEVDEEVFEGPLEGYSIYTYRTCDFYIWDRLKHKGDWYRGVPSRYVESVFFSSNGKYKLLLLPGILGVAKIDDEKYKEIHHAQKFIKSVIYSLDREYIKLISQNGDESVWKLSECTMVQGEDLDSIEFEVVCDKQSMSEIEVQPFYERYRSGTTRLVRYTEDGYSKLYANDPLDVKISSKGIVAAVYSNPYEILIWKDYRYNRYVVLKGHGRHIDSIEFSNDSSMLVSVSSDDCTIILWSTATYGQIETIPKYINPEIREHDCKPLYARFSHNDKKILIRYKYFVCLWDLETKSYVSHHYCGSKFKPWGDVFVNESNQVEVNEFPIDIEPYKMAHVVSPNYQFLAVHSDKQINIYNLKNKSLISSRDIDYEYDETSSFLKFSSDSTLLLIANRKVVSVWDMHSDGPILVLDKLDRVHSTGICSECELLYIASGENILILEHKPLQKLINYIRMKFGL